MADYIEPKLMEYLKDEENEATNYYLKVAVQNAKLPYGVLFKLDPDRDYTHEGASGLNTTLMQVSCFGKTYVATKKMAYNVIDLLEKWKDSEDKVQAVFLFGEIDDYNDESDVYHVVLQFIVWNTF